MSLKTVAVGYKIKMQISKLAEVREAVWFNRELALVVWEFESLHLEFAEPVEPSLKHVV